MLLTLLRLIVKQKKVRTAKQRNYRLALFLCLLCSAMIALSFASVPLYDLFCRATGFGGRTQKAIDGLEVEQKIKKIADSQQKIRVRFDANVNAGLDWKFAPAQIEMEVQLGEVYETKYIAKNLSEKTLKGVATYNVTPTKTGAFFHKIQCFCFVEQQLQPQQQVEMKVLFFLDPAIREHEEWGTFDTITLSYSFFPHSE